MRSLRTRAIYIYLRASEVMIHEEALRQVYTLSKYNEHCMEVIVMAPLMLNISVVVFGTCTCT